MKKSILNLVGVQSLTINEQKSIKGGAPSCTYLADGTRVCYKRCGTAWIPTTSVCCINAAGTQYPCS